MLTCLRLFKLYKDSQSIIFLKVWSRKSPKGQTFIPSDVITQEDIEDIIDFCRHDDLLVARALDALNSGFMSLFIKEQSRKNRVKD